MNPNARAARSRHPVIIATGEKSLDQLDFELPGPIALEWRRQYRSGDARRDGWFGQGWSHPLATELWVDDDALHYWDEKGREVVLPAIDVGQTHFEAYEQFTLVRPGPDHWALRHNQGLTHHFRRRHARQWKLPLEVIQDRNGRRIRLLVDDAAFGEAFDDEDAPPRPQRLVDSAGRTLHLAWTDHRQLGQVVVEAGGTRVVMATYAYANAPSGGDGLPDLASHTDPNGHTRTFAWEEHLLVGYTLATGQRFSNRYDRLSPDGRVVESLALDDGTGERFEYHGSTTRVRDRLGRETLYVFNARQDIVAVHDAEGHVTRNDYDADGRPEAATDALGRSSSTTFDARGNLVLMVDAAGNATQIEYNALDLPVKLTDAMGGEWRRQYDERGNLIASIDPLGHTTLYEVDAFGQVMSIVDALDKRKKLQWDDAGNLTAYTDCSGRTTHHSYDQLGRLTATTDALGRATCYLYDPLGRLLGVTQPDGAEHRYTWDANGNLQNHVDPLGHATAWTYNGAGAPLMRTDPLGHTRHYRYDAAGRLDRLTNENGEHTHFRYDALDRQTDEIGFDGRHQRYVYNAAGELSHVVERGGSRFGPGKVTRFERDQMGRMTDKRHIGEASEHAAGSAFMYDALGRLTQASNAVSVVTVAYDPLGQVTVEKQQLRGWAGEQAFEFQHSYDALGNRTRTVLPGGRELNCLFYGSGHLHQVNLDGRVVSNFERDPLHREIRRSQGALLSEFVYDQAGRLNVQRVLPAIALEKGGDGGSAIAPESLVGLPALGNALAGRDAGIHPVGVIERHYWYDASGQLVQWTDRHRGLTRYAYDAAERITQAHIGLPAQHHFPDAHTGAAQMGDVFRETLQEHFGWDAAGNPLPALPQGSTGGTQTQGHVAGNRLRVWHGAHYAHDEHGNVTERIQLSADNVTQISTSFIWDDAYQLVGLEMAWGRDGQAGRQDLRYAYDALGRRIAKLGVAGIVWFGWDGDRMALERSAAKETFHLYQPESFIPLAQLHGGTLHHLHNDASGMPLEASDEDGEITWRSTFRTWGALAQQDVGAISQPIGFQGQYRDLDSGLSYTRHRYYDPSTSRFISPDPTGLSGGFNFFLYAPNPVSFVDPLGLKYRPGLRSPTVLTGKDKPGNNNVSEWRRCICRKGMQTTRENFLGDDFVKVDEGKWRSLDGARQFRVTPSDFNGAHGMGFPTVPNTPHVHFEFLRPTPAGNFKVVKNVHVPLKKDC